MEERNRLARELHNSVSQTLFSMALNTRSAEIILKRKPSQARPQFKISNALRKTPWRRCADISPSYTRKAINLLSDDPGIKNPQTSRSLRVFSLSNKRAEIHL